MLLLVDVKTVTLGDLSGSESLLLLPLVDRDGRPPMAAFRVRCAVLLLSIFAILSMVPLGGSVSIEVKLVLFILSSNLSHLRSRGNFPPNRFCSKNTSSQRASFPLCYAMGASLINHSMMLFQFNGSF